MKLLHLYISIELLKLPVCNTHENASNTEQQQIIETQAQLA